MLVVPKDFKLPITSFNLLLSSNTWFDNGEYLGDEDYTGLLPNEGIRLDLDQSLFEARSKDGAIVKISPGEKTCFEASTTIGNPLFMK